MPTYLPKDFEGKAFRLVNKCHEPVCIDIHKADYDKSPAHPTIRVYPVNQGYLNQVWYFRSVTGSKGEKDWWSLQNVGTGVFLSTVLLDRTPDEFLVAGTIEEEEPSVPLKKIVSVTTWKPELETDSTGKYILLRAPEVEGAPARFARLSSSFPGYDQIVEFDASTEHKHSASQWILQEVQLRSEQIPKLPPKKAAAAPPPPAKVAEAAKAVPVGGTVKDKHTVSLLNKVGSCPNGFHWERTKHGFTCSGGGHHVSDAELSAHA